MTNFLDPKRQFTLGAQGTQDFLREEVISKHLTRGHMDLFRIMQETGFDPKTPLNFEGIDPTILNQMNFRFIPLEGKQFSEEQLPVLVEKLHNGEVVLEGLNFGDATIGEQGVSLDFKGCVFKECDFSKVKFINVDLRDTIFEKCKLPPARNFSNVAIGGDTFPDTKVGKELNRALQGRSSGEERTI
ncbi:MAG: Pentapeptide repeat (9 copies) [Rickettsiales bacterium]|jgi:uncharacterized protein YjbI with pentapeptide repeats|nr:Pentapeptide repeat (9 copies) [Rickettsiales bacterium]